MYSKKRKETMDKLRLAALQNGCFDMFSKLIYSAAWELFKDNKYLASQQIIDELAAVGMAKVKEVFIKDPNYYDPENEKEAALSTLVYIIAGRAMIDYNRKEKSNHKLKIAFLDAAKANHKTEQETMRELEEWIDLKADIQEAMKVLANEKKPIESILNEYYGLERPDGYRYHNRSKQELANEYKVSTRTIERWLSKGEGKIGIPLKNYSEGREKN